MHKYLKQLLGLDKMKYLALKTIAHRYFYGTHVRHHADCRIYCSREMYDFVFCSCGLLHDLNQVHDLAEILYPFYFNDIWLQNNQEQLKTDQETKEEQEDCEKLLYETFGAPEILELTELKKNYEEDKTHIIDHFGENKSILDRLEEKLRNDIEGRWKYEKYRKPILN